MIEKPWENLQFVKRKTDSLIFEIFSKFYINIDSIIILLFFYFLQIKKEKENTNIYYKMIKNRK